MNHTHTIEFLTKISKLGTLKQYGGITWQQRLWAKIAKKGPDECWEWTAGKNGSGYGTLIVKRKLHPAHRLVWEDVNGPIPKGMNVCHTCDNRKCCNPKHLWLGTQSENILDMFKKGRHPMKGMHGQRHPSSKISDEVVIQIRREHVPFKVTAAFLAKKYGLDPRYVKMLLFKHRDGLFHRRPYTLY